MYFTTDFDATKASVQILAVLEPAVPGTGHGRAIEAANAGQAR
jgi:hypothetical protein